MAERAADPQQSGETQQQLQETPDLYGAYPRLSQEQIARLSGVGDRRPTKEGEILYRAGDRDCDFFVILSGKGVVLEEDAGEERVIAVHGPGRFLGELSLLTGEAVFVTAEVREPGEVLAVQLDKLRELVVDDIALGDLILRAYMQRRSMLIELGIGFRIIGSRYSPDTRRLREFASRNRLPHSWVDLEDDPAAEEALRRVGITPDETPVLIVRGDCVLRNPSNDELAH